MPLLEKNATIALLDKTRVCIIVNVNCDVVSLL